MTPELRAEIDSMLAKVFYRTDSLQSLDSAVFRDFVEALSPEYAKEMPKSRCLSGRLLDEEYQKSFNKLNTILEEHENLALVTDGWTNVNGHHIVNFGF